MSLTSHDTPGNSAETLLQRVGDGAPQVQSTDGQITRDQALAEALLQRVGDGGPPIHSTDGQITSDQTLVEQSIADQRASCAACKHQRKKCDSKTCIFIPFFPGDKKEEFGAVLQIFGVIKVKKMLESCRPGDERLYRANEIKWLANMLKKPPAEGPLAQFRRLLLENQNKNALISQLQNHIQNLNRYQANNVAFCNTPGNNFTTGGGSSRDHIGSTNHNMSGTGYYSNNSQVSQFGQMGNQFRFPSQNFMWSSASVTNLASPVRAPFSTQIYDMPSKGTLAALPPQSDDGNLMYR